MADRTPARRPATPKRLFPAAATLAMAVALAAFPALAQQETPQAAEHPGAGHAGMMKDADKGGMMPMYGQMMTDMKAKDARLDQKLAAMNAAKGRNKVDAIVAVINEMAAQRKEMMATIAGMHDRMMMPMGGRMGSADGASPGASKP